MANLLVMMEFYRGTLLSVSLEALGQARRLGSALGLTVYALVPLPSGPSRGDGDLTAACGLHGADKVVFLTGEALASEGEMRFQSYAPSLMQACTQLTPRLVLFGDTPAARDVAPRLAVRLGAAYLARGAAQERDGRLILCDTEGQHVRLIAGDETSGDDFGESEAVPPPPPPVVMTVPPGRFETAAGLQDADMLIISSQEREIGSDVTPVTGGGFVEERIDPQPLDERLGGALLSRLSVAQAASWDSPVPEPEAEADAAADSGEVLEPEPVAPFPPLWSVISDGPAPPGAMYRIAIGPDAGGKPVEYALVVPTDELSTTCQALRAQLLLPVTRPTLARRGRSVARPEAASGDGWAALENTETGESSAKTESGAADITPAPGEDSTAARLRRLPTPLGSAWDSGEPGASRDGVPEFELENADTAPVPIQTPSLQVAPVSSPSLTPLVRPGPRAPQPDGKGPSKDGKEQP
ncbi:MAG: hypothetical protein U1A78_09445 [Polyangia bacterium]